MPTVLGIPTPIPFRSEPGGTLKAPLCLDLLGAQFLELDEKIAPVNTYEGVTDRGAVALRDRRYPITNRFVDLGTFLLAHDAKRAST